LKSKCRRLCGLNLNAGGPRAAAGICDAAHRQAALELIELVRPAACRAGAAAALRQATTFRLSNGQQGTAAMDDSISELNERLTASCRETLQQLDDIEAKLAGLHAAIARSTGPQIAAAVTVITAARWISP
jgi:hypothetical protein